MPIGAAVRRAMELGISGIEEYVSPRLGRWVETRVYPAASGVSLYLRDIDERKRRELERDELSERLAARNAALEGTTAILDAALNTQTEEELGRVCLAVSEQVTDSAFGFIGEVGPDGLLHDIAISDPGWSQCTMEDQTPPPSPRQLPAPRPLRARVARR